MLYILVFGESLLNGKKVFSIIKKNVQGHSWCEICWWLRGKPFRICIIILSLNVFQSRVNYTDLRNLGIINTGVNSGASVLTKQLVCIKYEKSAKLQSFCLHRCCNCGIISPLWSLSRFWWSHIYRGIIWDYSKEIVYTQPRCTDNTHPCLFTKLVISKLKLL